MPFYPSRIPKAGNQSSFRSIHPALGTMDDFNAFLRAFKKRGMQVVITLNFNSVPINHEFAKPEFLTSATGIDKVQYIFRIDLNSPQFCRTGSNCKVFVNGKPFYSTFGSTSEAVDLNLKSPNVLTEIKNATRFWLLKGVDGILLADAAFFIEEDNCEWDSWLDGFPDCKLYTPGTISVIEEIRKVIDEVSAETSRSR